MRKHRRATPTPHPGPQFKRTSEAVHKGAGDAGLLGGSHQGKEVVDVGVHAAVGDQTKKVHPPGARHRIGKGIHCVKRWGRGGGVRVREFPLGGEGDS